MKLSAIGYRRHPKEQTLGPGVESQPLGNTDGDARTARHFPVVLSENALLARGVRILGSIPRLEVTLISLVVSCVYADPVSMRVSR